MVRRLRDPADRSAVTTAWARPLWELAGRVPEDVAVTDPRRSLTWAVLDEQTTAFGHGLEGFGLVPGDHVALVARNSVSFVVALLGVQRAGMIVTPVKTGWSAAEVEYLLTDANSRAVVTDVGSARAAAATLGLPVVDLADGYDPWLGRQARSPLPFDRRGWRLSYTSGTTGRPKGVVRPDAASRPFSEAFPASAGFASALGIPPDAPHLVVSRLFHGAPLTFALAALAAGTPLTVMDDWDAAGALAHLAAGAGSTIMVPTMFRQLLARPAAERARLPVPTLRTIVHGGEPCPIRLKQRMVDWLGPVFVEYFGVSEGAMTLATSEEWLARPGTVGRIHTGAGVKILDDAGHEVPPGTEGNVYFEAGGAPFRYLGDPEKTAAAFRGSAFTAGDVGWVDADGYLFISGRAADVIVSAGVNVYPAVIEAALEDVPGVADLCVVGGPDEERGEVPVAVVVVATGHDVEAVTAALRARADDRIAAYEQPRHVVAFDELPRDETGKLLRRHVRDALWGDASPFAVRGRDGRAPT
jgi:long-chain acyl-CoA synthetase